MLAISLVLVMIGMVFAVATAIMIGYVICAALVLVACGFVMLAWTAIEAIVSLFRPRRTVFGNHP